MRLIPQDCPPKPRFLCTLSLRWRIIWLLCVYIICITLRFRSHRVILPDHIGLVKAFLDANLLPRVIAGTSAGGLIAALVGTRTDDELRELLVPRLADRLTSTDNEPFLVWFNRFRKTGARFDSVTWAKKACWFTRGALQSYQCVFWELMLA